MMSRILSLLGLDKDQPEELGAQPKKKRISSRRKRRRQSIAISLLLFAGAGLFTLLTVYFVIRPLAMRSSSTPIAQAAPNTPVRPGRAIPDSVIDQIKQRAAEGDARAQNDLGVLHQLGRAVTQDDAEAVRWYRRAAVRNSVLAQNNLAWMSEQGRGLERDYSAALFWYKLSAQSGNVAAQHSLAFLYERGLGLPPNPTLAAEWYERALRQGDESARTALDRVNSGGSNRSAIPVDNAAIAQRAALATPGFLDQLGIQAAAKK
jgi:hypothetical protein